MALSNRDRLTKALDLFTEVYREWVLQQLKGKYGDKGLNKANELIEQSTRKGNFIPKKPSEWDVQTVLSVIFNMWRMHFRDVLGAAENSMLHELQSIRNDWAHQKAINTNDALRALDTIGRLLKAVSGGDQATIVERLHGEVMRTRFAEMQRVATSRAQRQATEGTPQTGLRPWREVIIPHPDVREGNFTQAEFAADLAQVHRGGTDTAREYADPAEFFRRTFITEGLRGLIVNALKRLNGKGGHPVIELQTNFGGGKTHSMLALYHLVSGMAPGKLSGIDVLLSEEKVSNPPAGTKRAVLVGTAISPGQSEKTADGLSLNTLWGRLAYQLGGSEAYKLIAESDAHGTSPGSDDLVKLFKHVGPCLILIDEWVAFCRQTYETHGLPGGTFDQNLTFAQALTEAVKACPQALLVASLPQSQIEVGGTGGKEALASLEDTFARLEFNWHPANQQESYEIVRRRLFESITDPQLYADRDAAIAQFFNLYAKHRNEFPSDVSEGTYEDRMRSAYPVHPELFDRLYNDWSSLEEFQRTRGVLRMMATVIHVLWARQDKSLMIMPGLLPMDDQSTVTELTRYLPDNWKVIMGTDVDGTGSLPARLDNESSRFGQYWATRRVSRTVYMGSAPVDGQSNRGLDIRKVRLGCVQPGENVAVFGDALRQLGDHASHLYADSSRYWFATQPNVLTMARDRAGRIQSSDREEEVNRFLQNETTERKGFNGVHIAPAESGDVPDEADTRLVVFQSDKTHSTGSDSSIALNAAREWLEKRGNSPRQHRNALIFVAADKARLEDLKDAAAWKLAWEGICNEREALNLDPFNAKMAEKRLEESEATLRSRLPETFQWILIPAQPSPLEKIEWDCRRLGGSGGIVERAWNKLKREGQIADQIAGTILRHDLDRYLWQDQPHISVKQLSEYYSQYPYLQRLTCPDVVLEAIRDGVNHVAWNPETFAYADRYDEQSSRYIGLKSQTILAHIATDGNAVLVKPDVAIQQIQADQAEETTGTGGEIDDTDTGDGGTDDTDTGDTGGGSKSTEETGSTLTRYYGVIDLEDATRVNRDVATISNEIIQHLTSILGANVEVSLEINANIPGGLTEQQIRILSENSRTLRFRDHGFE